MRPDDITIQEIAKKHFDVLNTSDTRGREPDFTREEIEGCIADAITEALDRLSGAELASQLARARNDSDGWLGKYLERAERIKSLEQEITDLRFAAEGWKHKATAGRPIDL